jgi:ornithine cyclodeaminase
MTHIYGRSDIIASIAPLAVIAAVEAGFLAFSRHEVISPGSGSLLFPNPPGDAHIRYGYLKGAPTFVVKVASSFYDNPKLGLPSSNGLMLVFDARTGATKAILLDEGYLTDLRTAAAGAVAARYLAPKRVSSIGIVGAGIQARMQLDLLRHVTDCRQAVVWARDPAKAREFKVEGFDVAVTDSVGDVLKRCNLVVTTTPSSQALLLAKDLRPGTHITAVGADQLGKQELDPQIFARADIRAVDSRVQCFDHGDSAFALKAGLVAEHQFIEIGEIVARPALGRKDEGQITVADLTGLAVQDIQIANAALANLEARAGGTA